VPRPTRGPLPALARTGLSPAMARRSRRFRFAKQRPLAWSAFARHYWRSLAPRPEGRKVWLMSFPPANEIFQFAGFASCRYGFTTRYPLRGGLPHSEISGSPGARPSPELFAACHVLHRLSVPRHPPDALLVLAHAQPQGRAARGQMSDAGCQMSDGFEPTRPAYRCIDHSRSRPLSWSLRKFAPTRATALAYLHTHARARPIGRPGPKGPVGPSCHARFTVTTRFTMSKTSPAPPPAPFRSNRRADLEQPARASPRMDDHREHVPVRPFDRTHACWWAWADSNGRPHAYQACALTS